MSVIVIVGKSTFSRMNEKSTFAHNYYYDYVKKRSEKVGHFFRIKTSYTEQKISNMTKKMSLLNHFYKVRQGELATDPIFSHSSNLNPMIYFMDLFQVSCSVDDVLISEKVPIFSHENVIY